MNSKEKQQQIMQNKQMKAQKEAAELQLRGQITQTHLSRRYYPWAVSSSGTYQVNEKTVPLDTALNEAEEIISFVNKLNTKTEKAAEVVEKVDMQKIKKLV